MYFGRALVHRVKGDVDSFINDLANALNLGVDKDSIERTLVEFDEHPLDVRDFVNEALRRLEVRKSNS